MLINTIYHLDQLELIIPPVLFLSLSLVFLDDLNFISMFVNSSHVNILVEVNDWFQVLEELQTVQRVGHIEFWKDGLNAFDDEIFL